MQKCLATVRAQRRNEGRRKAQSAALQTQRSFGRRRVVHASAALLCLLTHLCCCACCCYWIVGCFVCRKLSGSYLKPAKVTVSAASRIVPSLFLHASSASPCPCLLRSMRTRRPPLFPRSLSPSNWMDSLQAEPLTHRCVPLQQLDVSEASSLIASSALHDRVHATCVIRWNPRQRSQLCGSRSAGLCCSLCCQSASRCAMSVARTLPSPCITAASMCARSGTPES